jgi:hypothetical protein
VYTDGVREPKRQVTGAGGTPRQIKKGGTGEVKVLTIRAAQMRVLEDAFLTEWVRAEVQKLFPKECAALGPVGLLRFTAESEERAKRLELTRDDLLLFLSMEICFGAAFVENPANEWARKAAEGPVGGRMQRLRRAGIFHLGARVERERCQQAAWAAAEAQAKGEQDSQHV